MNATIAATRVLFAVAAGTGFVIGIIEVRCTCAFTKLVAKSGFLSAAFWHHHLPQPRLLHHKLSQEGNSLKNSTLKRYYKRYEQFFFNCQSDTCLPCLLKAFLYP